LFNKTQLTPSRLPKRYPYFDVVEGLLWLKDPESYTGGRVATGKVSHTEQVEGDKPD